MVTPSDHRKIHGSEQMSVMGFPAGRQGVGGVILLLGKNHDH
jgi:hypothetical protein